MPKKKRRKDITLSPQAYAWIEEQVKEYKYASFSHCIEVAVRELMKSEKK